MKEKDIKQSKKGENKNETTAKIKIKMIQSVVNVKHKKF